MVVIMGRVVSGQKMSLLNHKRKSALQFKAMVQLTVNTPQVGVITKHTSEVYTSVIYTQIMFESVQFTHLQRQKQKKTPFAATYQGVFRNVSCRVFVLRRPSAVDGLLKSWNLHQNADDKKRTRSKQILG